MQVFFSFFGRRTKMREVKIGMIGYGGIAKAHMGAYKKFIEEGTPIKVVSICDINPEQFESAEEINIGVGEKYDLNGISLYTDIDEMLAKEDFEIADICLPTYLHCEYTLKMFEAGKHVICEKPMALCEEDCHIMAEAAIKYSKQLMIAQCLRFDPNYLFIKKCIDENTFGKVIFAQMSRMSALPKWGFQNWFQHTECSGGCALDMHIHDVDMVRFLFGEPRTVSAVAYDDVTRWQYINSRFHFEDEKVVTATCSWEESDTTPFYSDCRIRFEKATVLILNDKLTIYPQNGKPYTPEYEHKDRIAEELRTIAMLVTGDISENTDNKAESSMKSVALVKKLCESADSGGVITAF